MMQNTNTETIYGKFTQKGIVSEVKPSAVEEARMMRQMSFLPEGLRNVFASFGRRYCWL